MVLGIIEIRGGYFFSLCGGDKEGTFFPSGALYSERVVCFEDVTSLYVAEIELSTNTTH